MPKLTPQQAREKQATRLKGATSDIIAGVDRVTVAPGQQAAKKADKMLQNITTAVQSGRWGKRVAAVGLDDWKTSMKNKGVPRIAQGIDAAAGKVEAFFTEFFPFLDGVQAEINKMPDLTLEDNINRMTATVRSIAKFKRGGGR